MAQKKENVKKSQTAEREEEVLEFWKKESIFEKTLAKESPEGEFVFYDGPPFATGLPHSGSLLSSIIKDVIPRYKTMQGYHVRRVWGWDCHGLPIENMIEKELGIKDKKEILEMGVDKFNDACRASVLRYADEWEKYVDRVGRWVDFKGAYMTMDNSYIESTWWALSELYNKELLYEGRKVLLYCPHCETPLAKAEIAQDNSYKDVSEESVYVKFKVTNPEKHKLPENTYLLAWTTTPWTLPGNVALAVGEDIEYVVVKEEKEHFVVAKELCEKLLPDAEIVEKLTGKKLVGLSYEPLFVIPKVDEAKKKNAHTVLPADFVTTEDGTGIVHTAVIYGEDDYQLGLKHDLPMVPLLNASGYFNDDAPELIRGLYFKKHPKAPVEDVAVAERFIKKDLEERELMFKREVHSHSYPHCHRCDTPLIYNALTSWFINIQKVKKRLLATNEFINWHPEHLQQGRYKNIVENAPDWTISRNRFWASPMPIWRHPEKDELLVIDSLETLKKHTKTSGNSYLMMRHGQTESNVKEIISSNKENKDPLTEEGVKQVEEAVKNLPKSIDLIIHSGFKRTKETAELIAKERGIAPENVIEDDRIAELQMSDSYEGKPWSAYNDNFATWEERYTKQVSNLENRRDVQIRAGEFLYDLETAHTGKTILIVSHAGTLFGLECAAKGATPIVAKGHYEAANYMENAEVRELLFVPLPHNANYELDLHLPYIDRVTLVDKKGVELKRVPEVIDGWVESGSMPFAERHYPIENRAEFEKSFPADFIAEYIAQTRTWFYYMHAMSVLLFDKPSFKHVVTTGNILAEDGAKMSKSKKNYTDPLAIQDEYGADAYRYYLMGSPVMVAEDIRFIDAEVREAHNRVVNLLWNTFKFYDLYQRDFHEGIDPYDSPHVLDQWMLARVSELVADVTKQLDAYNTMKAAKPIRDCIEDFSTWYVRRSRDRFKGEDKEDRHFALATTQFVLLELSKVIAPLMPFIAESIYRGAGGEEESVHLDAWPKHEHTDEAVLDAMRDVRSAVTLGLQARAEAGIKVRQPLQSVSLKSQKLKGLDDFTALILDELNVKEILFDEAQESEVLLATEITPALQEEGDLREVIRHIQNLRKEAKLMPDDRIVAVVQTSDEGQKLLEDAKRELKKVAGVEEVEFKKTKGSSIKTPTAEFTISISEK